jgi:hypothetical protein
MTITLGQIKNSSKTSAREIRELILAGIPANRILQEELGLTAKQIQNIGDQAIPGEVALAALMRGIEKNYGGAADAIQRTTLGLISTIRDNLLFISRDILKGPMKSYNTFVTRVADGLERIRMEGRKFGPGGIINAIFPPELHTVARIVFTSIGNIANNVKRLVAAFGPAASALNEFIFRGLALILPVIASVTNAISKIAYAATHSIPAVKYLGAAILALMGAGAATAMILHLAWAIRVLGIARAVSMAVMLLAKAVQVLYLAMAKNPVTAVIMVISAALLSLALSSATVSAWLDRVMKQMMGLMGMDGDSFALTGDATLTNQEDFNQSIIDGSKAWDDWADSANKAAKEVDNIQSFDEVHQIEDPNGNGDGGPNVTLPDIPIPKLPDITIPKIDIPPDAIDFPPIPPPVIPPPIIPPPILPIMPTFPVLYFPAPVIPTPQWPNLDPDNVPVLGKVRQRLGEWVRDTGLVLENWRQVGTQTVQGWASDFSKALDGWWANGVKVISDWGADAKNTLGRGLEGLSNSISGWGPAVALAFSTILAGVVEKFSEWRQNLVTNVSNTLETIKTFFINWGPTLLLVVGAIIAGILLWWIGLPAVLTGALAALVLVISSAFVNTKTAAAAELDKTKTMAVNKWEGIKEGLRGVWRGIKDLASSAWEGITNSIKGYVNTIIGYVNKMISAFNSLKLTLPVVDMPGLPPFGGGTIGVPQIPRIPYLAAGAVVTKDQLVRVAEAGSSEGVIPLKGSGAALVANALADVIISRLSTTGPKGSEGDIILQVGTLIGDERSLLELERRLKKLRLGEQARGVK